MQNPERKILYYPTIAIPQSWLKHTILYWDKVSSIAPKQWEDQLEDARTQEFTEEDIPIRDMKILMEAGEYEPIRPEEHSVDIKDEFEKILKSRRFRERINKSWFDYIPEADTSRFRNVFHNDSMERYSQNQANIIPARSHRQIGRVHRQKMEDGTIELLEDKKLAILDECDPEWYYMEGNTSMLYMALLAKYLADIDPDYTVMSTDWRAYESLIFNTSSIANGSPSLSAKFLDILPVPREDVRIEKIMKFKRKRKFELLTFWELLEDMGKEISDVQDKVKLKKLKAKYNKKIEKGILGIRNSMKESNIDIATASFKSLLDIKKPVLWESLATASLGSTSIIPLLCASALIQIGCIWIEKRKELRARIRESPYSYLYYAEEEAIF